MTTPSNVSTYRDILKKAFRITIRHKFLWIFGFFAAFMGAGGEFETMFRNYGNIAQRSEAIFSLEAFYQGGLIWAVIDNIGVFFREYPWQAFFLLFIIAVLTLVLIWLAIVSQIALFDAAAKIQRDKKVRYNDGFRVGSQHFWPVLLINIIVKAALYALFVVISAPLVAWFLAKDSIAGGFIFILFIFFVFVPLSVIVSFVIKYAIAYIVIEGKKTGEALRSGWQLFKKNWLTTIEMAVIVLAIGILVGVVIVLLVGIVAVPFIVVDIAALLLGSSTAFNVATVVAMVVWFVIVAVLGSAYVAFQYTAWTDLFLRLNKNKAQSKLMRWFGKIGSAKKS